MKKTTLSNGATWTTQGEPVGMGPAPSFALETPQTTGTKHDANKPAMDLVPAEAMVMLGKALGYGATKYGRLNYTKGIAHSRLCAAALRHIFAHLSGETIDAESGNEHIAHALASLAMLSYMMKHKPEFNDLEVK